MKLLLITLALLSFNTHADGIEMFAGAWSKHLISDGLNKEHNLRAIRYNGYIAGRFTNSYNLETWFSGKSFSDNYGQIEYGVIVGAMKGYTSCIGNEGSHGVVCPMIVPYVTSREYIVSPVVMLMGEAVILSFKIEL